MERRSLFAQRRFATSRNELMSRFEAAACRTHNSPTFKVKLDYNGNALVVILGGASCASGTREIAASSAHAPFMTSTTDFTVKAPEPGN